MQAPRQTFVVQALRNTRFVERIARGRRKPSDIPIRKRRLAGAKVRGAAACGEHARSQEIDWQKIDETSAGKPPWMAMCIATAFGAAISR
jgi:hypothetical protein